jgi:hypothetical protein
VAGVAYNYTYARDFGLAKAQSGPRVREDPVARSPATVSDPPRRSWVEQLMGLPISVLARGLEARSQEADQAVATVYAELRAVDGVFSPYRHDSDVSRIAAGELDWSNC